MMYKLKEEMAQLQQNNNQPHQLQLGNEVNLGASSNYQIINIPPSSNLMVPADGGYYQTTASTIMAQQAKRKRMALDAANQSHQMTTRNSVAAQIEKGRAVKLDDDRGGWHEVDKSRGRVSCG